MRRPHLLLLVFALLPSSARAHDIPNARVDRSIQIHLRPGRLTADYEVSLSELTLTRDLRDLIGALPDGDRRDWLERYGQETALLNAKGLLISVDGRPLPLQARGFDLKTEEHPQYTFHFAVAIPPRGRLKVQDTNFVSSEGTSRLALRGEEGVVLRGDLLPADVQLISVQPLWLMSDLEERRSKQAELDYHTATHVAPTKAEPTPIVPSDRVRKPVVSVKPERTAPSRGSDRLSRLLDRSSGFSLLGLTLIAFGLGAAHAIQPGHGKTLVAATVVAERGSWLRGTLLALVTTATHTGSVLLVALGLWLTRSSRYELIHSTLTMIAGFVIAAIGFWRLGRHLGGYGEHDEDPVPLTSSSGGHRNIVGLGVVGGLVPCWDAVALILLAEAVGQLRIGVVLLVAFGLGMAAVLIAVGWMAARCRQFFTRFDRDARVEHWVGVAGSLVLCVMGVYLLGSP
ncbi:ABC-type nickel/cobalt efflux system, permease component RcnA [Singulisphaera sp. GP187]|uniref:HoxN/HupN/NixA family nickel/cobalt transporter n=1 Tax=Singulisphaera sp. GP187 TaxID=1882752 RepID=UPI00092673DB|nr:cytochrome c biogenesis protein CcdA [Singulisphaera sp. GP187]SIO04322.1 ABC-type nickel/cobalt efflux system, permease component RcnA [Singulisphaera sp. GP187]